MRARTAALLLAVLVGCAAVEKPSLPPDHAFAEPSQGVVIIGAEYVDRNGEPLYFGDDPRPTQLQREATGEELRFLSTGPAPVTQWVVALPPGWYRLVTMTRDGVLEERFYALRFNVEPGALQYAGTIRSYGSHFKLLDDYDAAVQRFRARYPKAPGEVKKTLFVKWSCYPDCVEQAWGVDGSP